MKHFLLVIVLFSWLFLPSQSSGQVNLVPNGDFEDTTNCNDIWSFMASSPWFNPNMATPDYYGILQQCGYSSFSNPNGYQLPIMGNSYIGLYYYSPPNTREYLEIDLINNLISNHLYEIKYSVSRGHIFQHAVNRFEVCFSDTIITNQNPFNSRISCNSVQLNGSQLSISDTINWVELTGSYIANGSERFLTIGNFSPDSIMTITLVDNTANNSGAYYYIDNVSLVDLGVVDIHELDEVNFSIYPNPTTKYLIIESTSDIIRFEINDLNGFLVLANHFISKKNIIDLSNLSSSMYYLTIYDSTSIYKYKIIKI